MRELDELLLQYLERRYAGADDQQKAAFERLLELSDPELMGYLLQNQTPATDIAIVVEQILDRADA